MQLQITEILIDNYNTKAENIITVCQFLSKYLPRFSFFNSLFKIFKSSREKLQRAFMQKAKSGKASVEVYERTDYEDH